MKNSASVLALLAGTVCIAMLAAGCRSRANDTVKNVAFISTPDEATVFINGKNCGLTPHEALLDRNGFYEVRFSKPGFFDENRVIEPKRGADGVSDIVGRVEVTLVRVSADALTVRERRSGGNATDGSVEGTGADAAMSPAARELFSRERPTDFTERLLLEDELKDLLRRGAISREEYDALRDRFCPEDEPATQAGNAAGATVEKNGETRADF